MVDTQNLEEIIRKSGKSKVFLAKQCGLTPQGLDNKIKNRTEFKFKEVLTLKNELNLKNKTLTEIFLP